MGQRNGTGRFLGVDIGGTFTDLVWHDPVSGAVFLGKGPTNPEDASAGVLDVVTSSLPGKALDETSHFIHATTTGLNAVLERKGAVVGLLTTAGFRDVLEIRRGDRASMYDVLWRPSEPLVARSLRLGVRERIRADGAIVNPLEPADVRDALATFRMAEVECIAICFIHAYVNPEHETQARELLLKAGFGGEIALSHEVSGEYREFERTATTVVDAYVRPAMADYLGRLEDGLQAEGFRGKTYVSRSGGGVLEFAEAASRPVETIISGPAAGVVGVAKLSQRLGLDFAIAADVGGTSFDTALLLSGEVPLLHQGQVGDLPVQTPWVDVHSIGAGGGSIAYLDAGGLLRVGPQSAGAVPGPACYDLGGTEPTVTDAAAFLGMLADGHLAGGTNLNFERARSSLETFGTPLSLSSEHVATGIITIAVASMAGAIRTVTIGKGIDPRDAHLVAYGGAGPMLAILLARELGIGSIVIPPHAGAFSAAGLLAQDLTRQASVTAISPLNARGVANGSECLAHLFERLMPEDDSNASGRLTSSLDCRYVGQEYALTVDVPSVVGQGLPDAGVIQALFEDAHRKSFGYELDDAVEIVTLRATVRQELGQFAGRMLAPAGEDGAVDPTYVEAWSFQSSKYEQFSVVDRSSLTSEAQLEGPAIVLEPTATTYLDRGAYLRATAGGELVISLEQRREGLLRG
jgi:N-methylhydantoinase A